MMIHSDPCDANAFDVGEATTDVECQMMDEKYIYLTEDLGWKEDPKEKIEEE